MMEFIEVLQGLDDDTQVFVFLFFILGLILINMVFKMLKVFIVEFFKIFRKDECCKTSKLKEDTHINTRL
ncbi:MAG: hypothetical protein ACOC2W_03665 [bacterium]